MTHLPEDFVCLQCRHENCRKCIDVLRVIFEQRLICKCKRPNHTGEPVTKQIVDPVTETVYTPKMHILEDGTVVRDCEL